MNVRIDVIEIDGAPIADVELSVDRQGDPNLLSGKTNGAGSRRFTLPANSTSRVTAKKVGYLSTARIVEARTDFVEVRVVLRRTPALTLDAVRVERTKLSLNERSKLPVIDSTEIASAPGAILDIFDVFKKLRPDIGYQHAKCPGRRVNIYVNERRALDKTGLVGIKPGDIEEIRYINCLDKSIAADDRPQEGRFYITLKPGLLYDQTRGAYRPDSATAKSTRRAPTKPGVRTLIITDAETRTGVSMVGVTELKSGRFARTDTAGRILLDFAESTTVLVSIRRTGYVPAVVMVRNDIVTAAPVTVSLVRRGPGPVEPASRPPTAPTAASDTVAKLSVVGFYARFNDSTLPSSAFITSDQLRSISDWTALEAAGLRGVCLDQLFIDGVRVAANPTSSDARVLDALATPSMIAGAETYVGPEIAKAKSISPTIFFDASPDTVSRAGCLTALWTK